MEKKAKVKTLGEEKDFRPILIYFGILILLVIISAIILIALEELYNIDGEKYETIIQEIELIIACIVALIIYGKKIISDFKKLSFKDLMIILGVSMIFIGINEILSILLEKNGLMPDNQTAIINSFNEAPILVAVSTAIAAPILEELVFRYSLRTFIKKNIVFLIISSVIFGALHDTGIAFFVYALMGLGLGLIYLKFKKNVSSSIIVHILNNAFEVILLLISL